MNKLETNKNLRNKVFSFVIVGSCQYIVLTIIAMFLYAGGTLDNPNQKGYSFFYNFFSDLGRTTNHLGEPNTISWFLFTISAIVVGITMIVFYLSWTYLFKDSEKSNNISKIGSIFGSIAGLSFIGVAFTPYDLLLDLHIQFVQLGFLFTFLGISIYSLLLFMHSTYPKVFSYALMVQSLLSFLFLLLLFFGPTAESSTGLFIQVVGQKIIIYAMATSYIIQGYGAWQMTK